MSVPWQVIVGLCSLVFLLIYVPLNYERLKNTRIIYHKGRIFSIPNKKNCRPVLYKDAFVYVPNNVPKSVEKLVAEKLAIQLKADMMKTIRNLEANLEMNEGKRQFACPLLMSLAMQDVGNVLKNERRLLSFSGERTVHDIVSLVAQKHREMSRPSN